jgi:hypothetical protein
MYQTHEVRSSLFIRREKFRIVIETAAIALQDSGMKTNITMVYEINGEVTENTSGGGIEFHSEASDETDIP